MTGVSPIRVLHVFNRMDRGGAETWIVSVMRAIDRERIRFEFMVESDSPGAYDDEIRALGGTIHYAGGPRNLPRFAMAFRRIVRKHGPYDVIHSHVHHASGVMLPLAAWQGIPIRIAHSHSDLRRVQTGASLPRQGYYWLTEALVHRFATVGLATSRDAAMSLFGDDWERDARYRVLHCGIDLTPFTRPVDRTAVRSSLGIAADAFVVGHVGRFMPMKNHAFLVDVFAEVHARRPDARLLLVGDGPLRPEIERKVAELGLTDAVVFAGSRPDVPSLLRGAMDVFVFPSSYEGLGLAVVEAQAAGRRCVVSKALPTEAIICPDHIERLGLDDGHQRWARTILNPSGVLNESGNGAAIERTLESPFNLPASVAALDRVYQHQGRLA